MQIYRHMHVGTHPHVFKASLQIYSGLTFFLGKVALEKVSLDANTRKGGHFETLGKRLFIGPLALATFLLVLAGDAFSTPLRSNISNAKYKFRSTHTHVKTLGKLLFIRSDWRLRNFLATPSKRCIRRPSTPESRCWAPTFFYLWFVDIFYSNLWGHGAFTYKLSCISKSKITLTIALLLNFL